MAGEGPKPNLRARVRENVRTEIAEVAFDLFAANGFEETTAVEAAEAAGISRASFFRYFGSKEDAVFAALEATGAELAAAVAARPREEEIWTCLHRAFRGSLERYLENPVQTLARVRLSRETPSLRAHQLERQAQWRELICAALSERLGCSRAEEEFELQILVGAALVALDVAATRWGESKGEEDFVALIDTAFEAIRDAAAVAT